jgi:hypothetical protein
MSVEGGAADQRSVELPITTRASTTWNVNLAAGTGIVVNVWDGVNDQFSEPAWIREPLDQSNWIQEY